MLTELIFLHQSGLSSHSCDVAPMCVSLNAAGYSFNSPLIPDPDSEGSVQGRGLRRAPHYVTLRPRQSASLLPRPAPRSLFVRLFLDRGPVS